jgi:hypothetical protein
MMLTMVIVIIIPGKAGGGAVSYRDSRSKNKSRSTAIDGTEKEYG